MLFGMTGCVNSNKAVNSNVNQASVNESVEGGWVRAESPIVTDELRAIIDKALETVDGVYYIPVAFLASQVVAGTNYAVLCRAGSVVPDSVEHYAIMYIYEDPNGKVEITGIKNFDCDTGISDMPGGWSQPDSPAITDESKVAFSAAMKDLQGVSYNSIALVSSQVVNGVNYCFICEASQPSSKETSYALVYIYDDFDGHAVVNKIINPISD